MTFVASNLTTAEVAAMRRLGHHVDEGWIDWAVDQLAKGSTSDALCSLAAQTPPFNTFEIPELVDEALRDLGAPSIPTEAKAATILAEHNIRRALAGEQSFETTLAGLERLCIELNYLRDLFIFYQLQGAADLWWGETARSWSPDGKIRDFRSVVAAEFRAWLAARSAESS